MICVHMFDSFFTNIPTCFGWVDRSKPHMAMDQYQQKHLLGGWTCINPSSFHVFIRGTRWWLDLSPYAQTLGPRHPKIVGEWMVIHRWIGDLTPWPIPLSSTFPVPTFPSNAKPPGNAGPNAGPRSNPPQNSTHDERDGPLMETWFERRWIWWFNGDLMLGEGEDVMT